MRRILLPLVAMVGCVDQMDAMEDDVALGETEQALVKTDYFGWARDANGVTTTIPICWNEQMYGNGPPEPARSSLKAFVRRAIEETWQRESGINFTGWGDCNAGPGGVHGILLHMWTNNYGWTNFIHPPWEPQHADVHLPATLGETSHLRYTAIHEIGHALGIVHEQARHDNGGRCTEFDSSDSWAGFWPGDVVTPWDDRSVMNYCAPNPTELSPLDILGIQRLYGRKPGASLVGSRGLCAGALSSPVLALACTSGVGQIVGGMGPSGDWIRMGYIVGTFPYWSFANGVATAPAATGGFGALTMAPTGNTAWDRYKLKGVTLRGLGGRKLRGIPTTTGAVFTWDDLSVNWASGSTANEQWSFFDDRSIRGPGGLCLDVQGGNPAPGTRVQMYPCNGTPAQRWILGPDGEIRSLVSGASDRCLEVNRDETDITTPFPQSQPVRIATCTGTLRQKWNTRGAVTTTDEAGCLSIPAASGAVSQVSCSSTAADQVIDYHW